MEILNVKTFTLELFLSFLVVLSRVSAKGCNNDQKNLASQGDVSQSGTVKSASLAIDDDIRPAVSEHKTSQCAMTGAKELSWWQVDLGDDNFHVKYAEIHSTDTSLKVGVGDIKLSNDIDLNENISDMNWCDIDNSNEDTGKVIANCNNVNGQYLTIMVDQNEVTSSEKKSNKNLILCEVEVYGENYTNIALYKPTKQSSDVYNAVSDLAVDGYRPNVFYTVSYPDFIAGCTHTSEETDLYPWWRVDLEDIFLVRFLNIYNRGEDLHTRLHDIEIRIGFEDIATYTANYEEVGDILFDENLLCASFPDQYLSSGLNTITCSQKTLGKYVSIQIVKNCELSECVRTRANVKNVLTLCEVEVFGDKFDLQKFKANEIDNLSSEKTETTSFDDSHDEDDRYSWLMIDLNSEDVVFSLIFEMEPTTPKDRKMPLMEIRVGNKPITSEYNNKYFAENQLCAKSNIDPENQVLVCDSLLVGRYVTLQVQRQCFSDDCLNQEIALYYMKEKTVWGIPFKTYKKTLNVAAFKPTSQSSVERHGISSLAVDNIFPDLDSDDGKCSLTQARKYPWWRVDLHASHYIQNVVLHIPYNANETSANEIEIRIGDEDIADQSQDKVYFGNKNCAVRTVDSLSSTLECNFDSAGRYISVQLIPSNSKEVPLQLCEVQVFGCELQSKLDKKAGQRRNF